MSKRIHMAGLLTMLGIALAACGGDDEAAATDSFHPSDGAVEIGTTGVYLRDGERVDAAPSPSKTPSAPVIASVYAKQTGTYAFELELDVELEPGATIAWAYLDFGADGVYRAHVSAPTPASNPGGGGDYAQKCRETLAKQNIECTDACIAACDCVTCADPTVADNLKLACATTCSANVSSGAIDSPPYNGSEEKLADVAYNGDPEVGLPGTATSAKCNASACVSGGGDTTDTAKTSPFAVTFEAPNVPVLTPLVAPQVQTDDTPETSEPFAQGRVSVCQQGGVVACR